MGEPTGGFKLEVRGIFCNTLDPVQFKEAVREVMRYTDSGWMITEIKHHERVLAFTVVIPATELENRADVV